MHRCLTCPVVLLLALCTATPASPQSGFDKEITRAREALKPIVSAYPGLAVSVTVDGEEVWAEGYGFADIRTGQRATPNTRFNVYSVAKMFTGIAAARLFEMKHLDLDEPLVNIIEGLPDSYDGVTPRLLIGHLAGVQHYASDEDWRTFGRKHCTEPADALPHFADRPLVSEPRKKRTYSTYGYVLLSEVLARRSPQQSYTRFMQAEIFDVAEMQKTRLDTVGLGVKATPYSRSPEAWEEIEGLDASCKFGGGGFLSSARDLALFGEAFYDHLLLSSDMTQMAAQPFHLGNGESTYYGFGMDTNTFESKGRTVHWARHSGGSPGGRAFLVVLLTERVSVGIAANSYGPSLRSAASNIAYIFAGVNP